MRAQSSQNSLKYSLTLAAILGCSALVVPSVAQAATAAKTSWAVSRVASISQGSYCTMAQKYDDATVMTLARNTKGEYSLALDFQEPRFKGGEKQKVTLRAQGGPAQTYSVTPQSEKTAVVGIGKDDALVKQLAASESLSVEIGAKSFDYVLSQFASGQKEMGNCIEALTQSKDKTAELATSAKTGMASPEAQVKRQVAVVETPKVEDAPRMAVAAAKDVAAPSVEGLLAAKPTPSDAVVALSSEEVDVVPVVPKIAAAEAEDRMKKAIKEEPVVKAVAKSEEATAVAEKTRQGDEVAVRELRQQLAAQQAQNEKLQSDLMAQTAKQAAKEKESAVKVDPALQQSLEALKAENTTLKNQMQLQAKAMAAQPVAAVAQTAEGDDKLRAEIRSLRAQMEQAQAEKISVQEQLDKTRKESENKQMKMADGNWDLEQATRRYQESQREIQRLGGLIQSKEAQCTKEKKEIEAMLFDPAIAKSSQVAMLNSLEDQVQEKDGKIKVLEGELASVKAQVQATPEKDKKISDLEKQLASSKAEMAKKLDETNAAQNALITSLKSELAAKDKQILDASQSKSSEVEVAKNAVAAQEKVVAALKVELAQKTQQVAELQTKAVAAEKVQAAVADKDKTLAALQAELAQKTQLLSEAQSKSQQSVQAQAAASVAQESTIGTLKAQVAQLQAQLLAEQTRGQQIDAKASAEQATALATLQMQIQQGNQKIAELQGQINGMKMAATQAAAVAPAAAASMPAVAPVVAPTVSPAQPAAYVAPTSLAPVAPLPPAVQAAGFMSVDEFSSLLRNAGVPVKGSLDQVKGGDPASYRAYSWKTDSLYGSVEMRRVSDISAFENVIGQYLGRAKSRCSGEFAAVPSQVKANALEMSKSYEIACVNQSASSSASVLFTYGNGVAMTVAHEGRAEAMDLAMDARDRVAGAVK